MKDFIKLHGGYGQSVYYRKSQINQFRAAITFWTHRVEGSWMTDVKGDQRFVLETPEEICELLGETTPPDQLTQ